MSAKTGIQWCDATWNPIRGCSRVSEGCRNCYAEVVAARFSGPGQAYEGLARHTSNGGARWTGKIMFVEAHLFDPIRWKKPARIFVDSMSDLFHEGVTDAQLDTIFAVMALADRHVFQVLTKRPARMREYVSGADLRARIAAQANAIMRSRQTTRGFDHALSHRFLWREIETAVTGEWLNRLSGIADDQWPLPNVWLGVSVENQAAADERIPILFDTPAAVRFLSCEPLLSSVDLIPFLYDEVEGTTMPDYSSPRSSDRGLSWVIIGGESGPNARSCDVNWIRDIVDLCKATGVRPFVKQLGSEPGIHAGEDEYDAGFSFHHYDAVNKLHIKKLHDSHGGDWNEWPEDLRVREFPAESGSSE